MSIKLPEIRVNTRNSFKVLKLAQNIEKVNGKPFFFA